MNQVSGFLECFQTRRGHEGRRGWREVSERLLDLKNASPNGLGYFYHIQNIVAHSDFSRDKQSYPASIGRALKGVGDISAMGTAMVTDNREYPGFWRDWAHIAGKDRFAKVVGFFSQSPQNSPTSSCTRVSAYFHSSSVPHYSILCEFFNYLEFISARLFLWPKWIAEMIGQLQIEDSAQVTWASRIRLIAWHRICEPGHCSSRTGAVNRSGIEWAKSLSNWKASDSPKRRYSFVF